MERDLIVALLGANVEATMTLAVDALVFSELIDAKAEAQRQAMKAMAPHLGKIRALKAQIEEAQRANDARREAELRAQRDRELEEARRKARPYFAKIRECNMAIKVTNNCVKAVKAQLGVGKLLEEATVDKAVEALKAFHPANVVEEARANAAAKPRK